MTEIKNNSIEEEKVFLPFGGVLIVQYKKNQRPKINTFCDPRPLKTAASRGIA